MSLDDKIVLNTQYRPGYYDDSLENSLFGLPNGKYAIPAKESPIRVVQGEPTMSVILLDNLLNIENDKNSITNIVDVPIKTLTPINKGAIKNFNSSFISVVDMHLYTGVVRTLRICHNISASSIGFNTYEKYIEGVDRDNIVSIENLKNNRYVAFKIDSFTRVTRHFSREDIDFLKFASEKVEYLDLSIKTYISSIVLEETNNLYFCLLILHNLYKYTKPLVWYIHSIVQCLEYNLYDLGTVGFYDDENEGENSESQEANDLADKISSIRQYIRDYTDIYSIINNMYESITTLSRDRLILFKVPGVNIRN